MSLIFSLGINMNIRDSASIVLWSAVIFSTNVIAKDIAIYRWLDENNVVHFSQHQPKDSNYSQLTTVSSYRARENKRSNSDKRSTIDEQLSKYEQDKAEVFAKNKEIAKKNCKAAQLNEQTLNAFDSVMFTDANGQSRALSEKEKQAQLALSKEHISMFCDKGQNK
mgnify:CR=1 FL=1